MISQIHMAGYGYDLPDDRIAKYPLPQRDASKLLVFDHSGISEAVFFRLPELLPKGTLLVFNNSKVIRARIIFKRSTGATIEVFCLDPCMPNSYMLSLAAKNECSWVCAVGNLKRWREESLFLSFTHSGSCYTLSAKKVSEANGEVVVRFSWDNPKLTFAEVLEISGVLPIPPYLHRSTEDADYERYQTVYSKYEGSVAAPTAGLHFTQNVLNRLENRGIETSEITLHVGAGTFKPVKSNTIQEHEMHAEHFDVSLETLIKLRQSLGKIVAVGTTSVRCLESIFWIGLNLLRNNSIVSNVGQWIPYEDKVYLDAAEVVDNLVNYLISNNLCGISASTQILIAPPYRFRMVKGMVTNFHQPQSTLLLLVAAMTGNRWRDIYRYALEHNFRFLSYGDSSLILQ
ncbi:MAG: S-adenosylmethionine:tRNA ribosyltransferase-isomerase [Prevotellaceae bacterium]|jgi:S-adenosylmethionine:tRNA ribosyltransferase-isomerase|nr:S-adenosylmethionine:tRNA ribosyltransferase-isomerase [Prevotellaceae bacterium]